MAEILKNSSKQFLKEPEYFYYSVKKVAYKFLLYRYKNILKNPRTIFSHIYPKWNH